MIELEFWISKWQEIDLLAIHNHNITKFIFQTGNYGVLPTEPLYDVKEHIANVLTELPSHLEKDEKIAFQDIIECSFGGKEKLSGCDYRLAAVIVAQYLRGNDQNI